MKNKIILTLGLLSLLMIISPTIVSLFKPIAPSQFSLAHNMTQNIPASKAFFISQFASDASTSEVHSATAIELDNNNIMAFWYGGTREGHKDVSIYQNTWHNESQAWDKEKSMMSRSITKNGTLRYIRKLGNPVVTRAKDNSIWLFYVSVSVGGWAGSAINLTRSYDDGQSWSAPQRLITSPFLNISTLIKGSAIHYTDGTIGLPVYHELLGKFGELLKINPQGEVIDKIRLSWGKTSLQPVILPLSPNKAIALMRYQGDAPYRILQQSSDDAGLTWTIVKKTALPNPGAGIMGLALAERPNTLLLAFNNDTQERDDMTLATSSNNGISWQVAQTIEKNKYILADKKKQFAYPWLLQTQNGNIHLLYTWHKSHIKHSVFNTAWLNQPNHGGL